jgi:hypothetical protein
VSEFGIVVLREPPTTTLKHVCCPKWSYLDRMLRFIFIFLQVAARKIERILYNDGIG